MSRGVATATALAAAIGCLLGGCSATDPEESARSALSTTVDQSTAQFDEAGGSETTSVGDRQYALIYDPSAPSDRQVVTVDLEDAGSPAYGDVSTIAIRSMRTLLDSPEFAAAEVQRSDDSFDVAGDAFSLNVNTRDGLITQIELSAGSATSQLILMTYGITPEAQRLFDSAK